MAKFAYFADINGQAVQLDRISFKGGSTKRASSFEGYPVGFTPVLKQGMGWTPRTTATRVIEIKSNPSRHECDARCLNATGLVMKLCGLTRSTSPTSPRCRASPRSSG